MQSMIMRRLARLLLAAALLIAQQSAFAHQIWHDAARPAQTAAELRAADQHRPAEKLNALCELHTSLATALGALGSAGLALVCVAPEPGAVPTAAFAAAAAAALSPSSRDPPELL